MLKARMKQAAWEFRREPTRSEAVLWEALRRNGLEERRFRRQQPFGPFVVDFYCASERLVVEVDGGIHASRVGHDQARQECLESLGLRFLRVPAAEVESNLPSALQTIRGAFSAVSAVAVLPSPLVGEGPGEGGDAAGARSGRTTEEAPR